MLCCYDGSMRLVGITLGTFILAFLVWSILWLWGQSFQYQAYDHPLMNISNATPALQTNNLQGAQAFLKSNSQGGILLQLRMSSDGEFFTATDDELSFISELNKTDSSQYKGNKHFYYHFVFLKSRASQILSLDAWLSRLSPQFWILDIQDNALEIDRYLIEAIEKNGLQDKVIIRSDIDLVVSSLKSQKPLWIYGSTLSDLSKLLTMSSLHLESLVNFQRDYFFSPLRLHDRDMMNDRVLSEIRRRHKRIALGPVRTDLDRERALHYKPDILIVEETSSDKKGP